MSGNEDLWGLRGLPGAAPVVGGQLAKIKKHKRRIFWYDEISAARLQVGSMNGTDDWCEDLNTIHVLDRVIV